MEAVPPLVDTDMTAGRGARKMHPDKMAGAIYEGYCERKNVVAPGMSNRVLILNRVLPELVSAVLARS